VSVWPGWAMFQAHVERGRGCAAEFRPVRSRSSGYRLQTSPPLHERGHSLTVATVLRVALIVLCLASMASYVRRRESVLRDVALTLGTLVVVSVIALAYRAANWSDPLLRELGSLAFLAQPVLLLRLVAYMQRVARAVSGVAIAGLAGVVGAEMSTGPSLSVGVGLVIVTWYVFVLAYCVTAFVRSARRQRGVARHQASAVVAGSVLSGLTLFAALATFGSHTGASPSAVLMDRRALEVMLLAIGALLYCGFTPPLWLRKRWQMPAVYAFVTRSATEFRSAEDTLSALERFAVQATGARAAAVAFPRPDGPGLMLSWWDEPLGSGQADLLVDRLDGPFARAWLDGEPAAARVNDRMAPTAVRLAAKVGATALLVVPIGGSPAAPERLGILALFADRDWLFPDADLGLVQILANHTAVVLTSQRLLARADEEAEELKQANAALADNNRAKDEFLATLAHELRNPLAPVRLGMDLLRAKRNDQAGFERTVTIVGRQVTHMVRLIDDLMDLSRITHNKLELRRKRVNLTEVVFETVEGVRPTCERAGQTLTLAMPSHPLWLEGDPVRLAQIITNLLINASKYTHDGGSIAVTVTRDASEVELRVSDNGRGIPEGSLTRIFETFVQGDRGEGGLGIGLSLSRRLAQLHGGSIHAQSAGPGAGSEFTLRLPASAETAEEASADEVASAMQTPGPGGRRILVVDDNHPAAQTLTELLTLHGFTVRTAFDGREALDLGQTFRPDAVVMDLSMPRVDGYEAAAMMRTQPWGHDVLLIALSGWGPEQDRGRAVGSGFDRYMTKPVDAGELVALLAMPREIDVTL